MFPKKLQSKSTQYTQSLGILSSLELTKIQDQLFWPGAVSLRIREVVEFDASNIMCLFKTEPYTVDANSFEAQLLMNKGCVNNVNLEMKCNSACFKSFPSFILILKLRLDSPCSLIG